MNGPDPGRFIGETGCTVEVPDFWFNAWSFLDIVDCLGWGGSVLFEYFYVFEHVCAGEDYIVEGV